ncbi:hypothetical protein [Gloeothece verrucosa]|uniref:hypothetical protein n=1 Tax=Gloeothece verrucosa TaxID=2546359 RepID=UPI0005A5195A|nr:hypothetical protein [Gloeothece verrucosa]
MALIALLIFSRDAVFFGLTGTDVDSVSVELGVVSLVVRLLWFDVDSVGAGVGLGPDKDLSSGVV